MLQQIGPALVNLRQWLANQSQLPNMSRWTLKRILKKADFRWKLVRKSLKDQQDAVLMAFFSHELHQLAQAHEQGELSLWFYDETGLGLNPTVCMPGNSLARRFTYRPAGGRSSPWRAF